MATSPISSPPSKKPKLPSPTSPIPETDIDIDIDMLSQLTFTLSDLEEYPHPDPTTTTTLQNPKTTPLFKARFVPYPYTLPPDLPYPLTPSSSYVTINGNEESCGSSFSLLDYSLMASFDTCGLHFDFTALPSSADACGVHESVARGGCEEEEDVWDWDDVFGVGGVLGQEVEGNE